MQPTVAPGAALPWWIEDALAQEGGRVDAAPLQGDLDVDVAIVGGGYTGLWTALALRERDPALRVAVLEAEYCGAGPSGRNGGFLETYWPAFAELRERFGDEGALRLATLSERIPDAVEALGEDVWLRRGGMVMVATNARHDAHLEQSVSTRARCGEARARSSPLGGRGRRAVPVAALPEGRALPGLLDGSSRAARARAAACGTGRGRPAVRGDARGGRRAWGAADGGRLRAPAEIVVATNAAMTDWRPVRGRLTVFGSYIVLTEPVPDAAGRDRLDGRRGDHRRADVPALLPHDE